MDKKRILIVDDEPDLVETLTVRLRKENYECLAANDCHNGFELARTVKPDLAILDIMLPGMDGYRVARLLKFQKEVRQQSPFNRCKVSRNHAQILATDEGFLIENMKSSKEGNYPG
jgi:CheY-like chemotaxis protein